MNYSTSQSNDQPVRKYHGSATGGMAPGAYNTRDLQHPFLLPDYHVTLYLDGGASESPGAQERISTSLQEDLVAGTWTFRAGICCLECLDAEEEDEVAE